MTDEQACATTCSQGRIETDRLAFERMSRDSVDSFEFYEFVKRDELLGDATEHMASFL